MEQEKINRETGSSNLNTQQAIPDSQQIPPENPLQTKEKKIKSRIFIYIILGLIFLLIVTAGIFAFLAFSQKAVEKPSPTSKPSPIVISSPSPTPKAQEKESHWLNESTSAEADPAAGAIFTDLFLEGEAEKSVESFYSNSKVSIIPNLIYALIESIELNRAQKMPIQNIMMKAIQAKWRLTASWNSPKRVSTADGILLNPEFITFWVEEENIYLHINNPADPDQQSEFLVTMPKNNKYAEEIITIVGQVLGK